MVQRCEQSRRSAAVEVSLLRCKQPLVLVRQSLPRSELRQLPLQLARARGATPLPTHVHQLSEHTQHAAMQRRGRISSASDSGGWSWCRVCTMPTRHSVMRGVCSVATFCVCSSSLLTAAARSSDQLSSWYSRLPPSAAQPPSLRLALTNSSSTAGSTLAASLTLLHACSSPAPAPGSPCAIQLASTNFTP